MAPRVKKVPAPSNDTAAEGPAEEIHPWWGKNPGRVAYVTIYRVRGVTRTSTGVKLLVASCLPAADVGGEDSIRARWGPGRYTVQPLIAANRLAGNPITFDLPDAAGVVPGVELGEVEEERREESGASASTSPGLGEVMAAMQQMQSAFLQDALRQAREDRKQDNQMMVGILSSVGAGAGGAQFSAYLEQKVRGLEEENLRLREENRRLREDKFRRELGGDVWESVVKQAAPTLLPALADFVSNRGRRGGAAGLAAVHAAAPPGSPAAPPGPSAAPPAAPPAAVVHLPSAEDLDRMLIAGTVPDDLAVALRDLAMAGNLPRDHAEVLRRHLA